MAKKLSDESRKAMFAKQGEASQRSVGQQKGRIVTTQTRVFKFNELSPVAQEKAIERERDFLQGDSFIVDDVSESLKTQLEDAGVKVSGNIYWDAEPRYAHLVVEGDVATPASFKVFTSTLDIPVSRQIQRIYDEGLLDISITPRHNRNESSRLNARYLGDYAGLSEAEAKSRSDDARSVENWEVVAEDKWSDFANTLLRNANQQIDEQMSDKNIKETLEIQDYEFTEGGEVFRG